MKQRRKDTITKYLIAITSILVLFILVFAKAGVAISNTSDSNAEAIVVEGNNVIIQGNTTATDINTFIQTVSSGVDTVLFKNKIDIITDQPDMQGPFASAEWLTYIKADDGAQVSFEAAADQNDPTLKYFFYSCTNLVSLDGLSTWDVSNVTGYACMYYMFYNCSKLTSLDGLSAWDVSNVTGKGCMNSMFRGCSHLISLDGLSAWDVSNVTDDICMTYMFYSCSNLTSLDGLSAWNVSNVTNMNSMFQNCSSLTSLDGLSAWDVSNVTNMNFMFGACSRLTSLDGLSAWDVSNVTNMNSMFRYCSSLTSLDGLSAWDVSGVTDDYCMQNMFNGCSNLTSLDGLSAWDVSNVTGGYCMENMFTGCSGLTSLDGLSAWDVSNVKGRQCMYYMFQDCSNLTSIDAIANWNIDNARASSNGVNYMFYGCYSLASITLGGTSGFKLSSDMELPNTNWWPVDDTSATQGINTAALVTQSESISPSSLRWQRCTSGATNPMTPITNLSVTWPATTTLSYTGLLQTISASVIADGTALTKGKDFYITYSNALSNISDAIKDVGSYTATLHIRGAYTYSGVLPTTTVAINTLDLNRTTNPVSVYTVPSVFSYTGSALTPKTMIRLNIGDDTNPLYTYLVENTATRSTGDYTVSYKNNVGPGTATATVNPATSNLQGKLTANFTIAAINYIVTFDSNGGSAVETQEVMSGQMATKPTDPTKQGYIFISWCTDTSLTETFDFSTPITKDITLYAKWQVKPEPILKDGWQQDEYGWRYRVNENYLNDGWHFFEDEFGSHWYYFNKDSYMASSQWIWDEDYKGWYWLCSTGPMIEGCWQWIDNAWYGFWWAGKMCQGWVWDSDYKAWYYCFNNGVVALNTWVGPYRIDASGKWIH